MQTLLAHSAFWRGVSLFAGMLMGKAGVLERKIARDSKSGIVPVRRDGLVSWTAGARSRREDELARGYRNDVH